ncbi:MAG TPA: VCBS repeat-containing protein [Lacunisphaera sp.]|nr:VCBS repeat-containing protein [Lacunisphaera sp.]
MLAAAGLGLGLSLGCFRQESAPAAARPAPPAITEDTGRFHPESIGAAIGRPPWIAHLTAVDLDRDGRLDLLFCEAQDNEVRWLHQTGPGIFEEKLLAGGMKAPVHVEAADMDGDGDLDVLVASMSVIFPHNDRIGTVFILENDGRQHFTPHAVLENTSRVTDVRAADLNGDGRMDLALAQFGYDQGEVSWLEQTGPWQFRRHVLLELSGAINVAIADFNGDYRPDIVALISQQWEEVHYFQNDGGGNFSSTRLWGSTNEDYGSSGLAVADVNRDGRPDLIYTNGDGFDYAVRGHRPWHGLQWLENTGQGQFRFHRVGDFPGAYSPCAADLNGDGHTDLVAVSGFADWSDPKAVALMAWLNDGRQGFTPVPLAHHPIKLVTAATGDLDGDGGPEIVTGALHAFPPYDHVSNITLWRRK